MNGLAELAGDPDQWTSCSRGGRHPAGRDLRDPRQLELFGTMLSDLTSMQRRPTATDQHL